MKSGLLALAFAAALAIGGISVTQAGDDGGEKDPPCCPYMSQCAN